MITRITLDNYMSHVHTVIEPAAGLTVILGPNNCGKSAILSALQTLCGENDGDFMVRHGEQNCAVTVETDDGHSIIWRRIKGKVSYVLDGVEVHRAGRGNLPDDLQTLLRLPKVPHPNSDKQFDIHFGDQKAPIFLIDNEADTAAFFSTASDAEKLLEMQKRHKDKVRDARREQQKLTVQFAQLDAQMTALSPLDEIDQQLDAVEEFQRQLQADDLTAQSHSLLIEQIEKQDQLVKFRAACAKSVAPLRPPPDLSDLQPMQSTIDRITSLTHSIQTLRKKSELLATTPPPPEQIDTQPIEQQILKLTRADQFEQSSQARCKSLAALAEAPAIDDPAPLLDLITRISKTAATAADLRRSITDQDQQLARIDADINAWLWANPTCPTCGATTTRDNLFTGHAHPPARAMEAAHD